MATINKASRPRKSPTLTKSGKPRLGTLSNAMLESLASKASSAKQKGKLENRLKYNISRGV